MRGIFPIKVVGRKKAVIYHLVKTDILTRLLAEAKKLALTLQREIS